MWEKLKESICDKLIRLKCEEKNHELILWEKKF